MRAAAMAVMGVAVGTVAARQVVIILVAATEAAIIPMAAAIAQEVAIIPMAVSILVVTVTLAISTVACTIAVRTFTALSAELSVLDIIDPIVIVRITAIHLLLTMILIAVIGIAVNMNRGAFIPRTRPGFRPVDGSPTPAGRTGR